MNDIIGGVFFFLFFCLPGILVGVDFIRYLVISKRLFGTVGPKLLGIIIVGIYPLLFISLLDWNENNDCCTDSAVFSPEHRLTIYFWILMISACFFYSIFRKKIAPPLIEVIVNSLLLLGIVFNGVIGYHVGEVGIFNIPILLLFILTLMENQKAFLLRLQEDTYRTTHPITKFAIRILTLAPYYKFPLLLILCLPIVVCCSCILLLFGQKPDAVVRAFTETYKHGLSQWDYKCRNVYCGGHYLCSVAANGHVNIVKPQRLGVRRNHYIICNRQLLISNAFEERITEMTPKLHAIIRRNYNRVGLVIHRYYGVFENKYISDIIYILMKPLEWCFIVFLYLFDDHPENRIEKQYIRKSDGEKMKIAVKNLYKNGI